MTTPPDAKKDPATFKLGDNPNEYEPEPNKPSLAERIEAIAAMVHDGARFKPELRAIAAELREIAETLRTDGGNRPRYTDCTCYACLMADRLARREK